jgi:hypothetical protein
MVHSKVKGKHHHMVTINYAFDNLDAALNETPTLVSHFAKLAHCTLQQFCFT